MTPSLQTERLELRPGTATALRAELDGRAALAAALGVEVPAAWPPELYDADAVRWTLAQLGDRPDGGPFGFYYLILRPTQVAPGGASTLIGVGGFKGPPDARGEVSPGAASRGGPRLRSILPRAGPRRRAARGPHESASGSRRGG